MLILDGYNVQQQFYRGQEEGDLEDRRNRFLETLETYCVAARRNALVFFDAEFSGGEVPERRPIRRGVLAIVFTARGVTADDAILAHVEQSRERDTLKIITSDKVILRGVDRWRVATQTSEKFVQEMEHYLRQTLSPYDEQKQNGITNEEAGVWEREMGLGDKSVDDLLKGE
jgi:predicted RNA-binding protein with PIN domain